MNKGETANVYILTTTTSMQLSPLTMFPFMMEETDTGYRIQDTGFTKMTFTVRLSVLVRVFLILVDFSPLNFGS